MKKFVLTEIQLARLLKVMGNHLMRVLDAEDRGLYKFIAKYFVVRFENRVIGY